MYGSEDSKYSKTSKLQDWVKKKSFWLKSPLAAAAAATAAGRDKKNA